MSPIVSTRDGQRFAKLSLIRIGLWGLFLPDSPWRFRRGDTRIAVKETTPEAPDNPLPSPPYSATVPFRLTRKALFRTSYGPAA